MQQSDALDTKRCAEPIWCREKREKLYTKLMCVSHLLEQTSRQARAFPVIGDNEDALGSCVPLWTAEEGRSDLTLS
jgi:hypothetical protein